LLIKRSGSGRVALASTVTGFLFFEAILWWGFEVAGYNLVNHTFQNLVTCLSVTLFGLACLYLDRNVPRLNVLTFPSIWVLVEYLRTHIGFLSWPWGVLGYSQYEVLPVAAAASFTGVLGVSFLLVAVNTALAEIVHFLSLRRGVGKGSDVGFDAQMRSTIITLAGTVAFFGILIFLSPHRGNMASEEDSVRVSLVQGGVYKFHLNDPGRRQEIFDGYIRLTLEAAGSRPDMILWPSSSVPGRLPADRVLARSLSETAIEAEAYLLVGSTGYDKLEASKGDRRLANSAFLISPEGKMAGRYDKVMLLPFDEYLPLRGVVPWPSWIVDPDMIDSRAGEKLTVLNMGSRRFGVLICWESLFPDQFRKTVSQGVDFMVSMTNEAFTRSDKAHDQMMAMNVFRAVENGVPVLRPATTGITAVIKPDGEIAARVVDTSGRETGNVGYFVEEVTLTPTRTFYNRRGDLFMLIPVVIIALAMTRTIPGRSRRERPCSDS
jgi:apolipoprotein N-acyltransferase